MSSEKQNIPDLRPELDGETLPEEGVFACDAIRKGQIQVHRAFEKSVGHITSLHSVYGHSGRKGSHHPDRERLRITAQEDRALKVFCHRKREDSLRELQKCYQVARERLENKLRVLKIVDGEVAEALRVFAGSLEEVLATKMRQVMTEYIFSGTDFSLASGRIWAANRSWSEYLYLLYASTEDIEINHKELLSIDGIRVRLENLRASFHQEQQLGEIRNIRDRIRAIYDACVERGLNISEYNLPDGVLVSSPEELSVFQYGQILCDALWEDGGNGVQRVVKQIMDSNPDMKSDLEGEINPDLLLVPLGMTIDITSTDIGWEMLIIEIDCYLRSCNLIIDSSSQPQSPGAKLTPRALAVLKDLRAVLERESKGLARRGAAYFEEIQFLPSEARQILSTFAGIEPGENTNDYLRRVVPVINVACAGKMAEV